MSNNTRTGNSTKNAVYALIGYLAALLVQFANRVVFVHLLTEEYLGLSGLFSGILQMLALSELGVGTAIIYALYKPVAERDTNKIKSLMALYKKLYSIIGFIVLAVGFALTPFIQFFIKDMPDIPYIRIYFMLNVLNSGVSYFYTYKRSLIICDQKEYISTITTMTASIGTKLAQIFVLLLTHNYMLYLIVQVAFTRLENVIISKIADKKYPYLKDKDIDPLTQEEKDGIKKNVFAMMIHKIGDVVVNATDNIIASKILGLTAVGLLSNYTLITDNVTQFVTKMFSAITASIGNLTVTESKEHTEKVFNRILFGNFWLISFCSVCLYSLCHPFIRLLFGEKFVLSNWMLFALIGCFYLTGMRKTVLQFRNALGLFWNDRYKALLESVLNLSVSIPLTYMIGLTGVKLGTIISTLLTSFWIEGYILYTHYFEKTVFRYLIKQLFYSVLTIAVAAATVMICNRIPGMGWGSFIIKGIISVSLINVVYLILFFRTEEFRYYKELVAGKILRR